MHALVHWLLRSLARSADRPRRLAAKASRATAVRALIASDPGRTRPLTALALDLGFSSRSHFTAAFRRELGATPSALRARG